MKNESKKPKKVVKKRAVKSMFSPEELRAGSTKSSSSVSSKKIYEHNPEEGQKFDDPKSMLTMLNLVREVFREGGFVLIKSNKEDPVLGVKSAVFCKDVSPNDIFRLAIHSGIEPVKANPTETRKEAFIRVKEGFIKMADRMEAEEKGGVFNGGAVKVGVEKLQELKRLLSKLKRALSDKDEEEDEDDDD